MQPTPRSRNRKRASSQSLPVPLSSTLTSNRLPYFCIFGTLYEWNSLIYVLLYLASPPPNLTLHWGDSSIMLHVVGDHSLLQRLPPCKYYWRVFGHFIRAYDVCCNEQFSTWYLVDIRAHFGRIYMCIYWGYTHTHTSPIPRSGIVGLYSKYIDMFSFHWYWQFHRVVIPV